MNKNRLLQRWHIGCTLLAALFMVSCSQEELDGTQGEPLPAGQYPLELTASGLEVLATPAQASTRGTFEGNWDGVQSVNVKVGEEVKKYAVTAQPNSNTASLTGNDTDNTFWWNNTGETKTVMAWAPVNYNIGDKITLPEVWTKDDFAKYDIIGVTKEIAYGDANKDLTFKHLMAKVVVNLKESNYSDYLKKATTDKIKVRLLKNYTSGRLTTKDNGQLTISELKDVTTGDITLSLLPNAVGNDKPFASYAALVLPENVDYNDIEPILEVEVDGITYTSTPQKLNYSVPSIRVYYEAGKVTTFNITVKEEDLEVTVENSMDWDTNGATGGGSVEIP